MKSAILFTALLSTLTLTACGPSKAEVERQRLEEEAKKQIEFNTDINNAFIKGPGWSEPFPNAIENKDKDAPATEVNDKSNEVRN